MRNPLMLPTHNGPTALAQTLGKVLREVRAGQLGVTGKGGISVGQSGTDIFVNKQAAIRCFEVASCWKRGNPPPNNGADLGLFWMCCAKEIGYWWGSPDGSSGSSSSPTSSSSSSAQCGTLPKESTSDCDCSNVSQGSGDKQLHSYWADVQQVGVKPEHIFWAVAEPKDKNGWQRALYPKYEIGQWVFCTFDYAANVWRVIDDYDPIVRFRLLQDLTGCGGSARAVVIGFPCESCHSSSSASSFSQSSASSVSSHSSGSDCGDPPCIEMDFLREGDLVCSAHLKRHGDTYTGTAPEGCSGITAGSHLIVRYDSTLHQWIASTGNGILAEHIWYSGHLCGRYPPHPGTDGMALRIKPADSCGTSSSSSQHSSSSRHSSSASHSHSTHCYHVSTSYPGYDSGKKQVLGHNGGCYAWFTLGACETSSGSISGGSPSSHHHSSSGHHSSSHHSSRHPSSSTPHHSSSSSKTSSSSMWSNSISTSGCNGCLCGAVSRTTITVVDSIGIVNLLFPACGAPTCSTGWARRCADSRRFEVMNYGSETCGLPTGIIPDSPFT